MQIFNLREWEIQHFIRLLSLDFLRQKEKEVQFGNGAWDKY